MPAIRLLIEHGASVGLGDGYSGIFPLQVLNNKIKIILYGVYDYYLFLRVNTLCE